MNKILINTIVLILLSTFANATLFSAFDKENRKKSNDKYNEYNRTGWYVGIAYHKDWLETKLFGVERTYGFGLKAGYDFMDNLGVELRYTKSSKGEQILRLDKSIGIYLKPMLHLSQKFDIYGLLGVADTTIKRVRNVPNNTSSAIDLSYGIGLNYNFNKNYALYTDYLILTDKKGSNCKLSVKQWNIGLAYYWAKEKKEPKKAVKKAPLIPVFAYEIEPIYFDNDKTFLKSKSIDVLDFVADMMQKYPNLKIEIVGHADSKFNKAYNMNLSQRRANKARKYLIIKHHVDRNRLGASAKGESKILRYKNSTKEDMAHSRRVEFEIISR